MLRGVVGQSCRCSSFTAPLGAAVVNCAYRCVGRVSDEIGKTVSEFSWGSIVPRAGLRGESRSEERLLVKERGIEENGKLEHVMRFSDPPFLCKQIDSFSFRA